MHCTASTLFLTDGEGHNNAEEEINSARTASAPEADKVKHVSFESVSRSFWTHILIPGDSAEIAYGCPCAMQ